MIIDISETVNISRSMRQMNYRLLNRHKKHFFTWSTAGEEFRLFRCGVCRAAPSLCCRAAYLCRRPDNRGHAATFTRELTAAAVGVAWSAVERRGLLIMASPLLRFVWPIGHTFSYRTIGLKKLLDFSKTTFEFWGLLIDKLFAICCC
jgi:hypothetical protein